MPPVHMTRLVFPLLAVVPAVTTALLVSLSVPPTVAMTAVVLLLIACVALLERRRPFRDEWNRSSRQETVTDLLYIALASVPDRLARVLVDAGALVLLGVIGASSISHPSDAPTLEPVARAVVAFLIADLGKYAIHRLSHESPWLWRFHLAHHQPARLSAMNALRLHPVNIAYNAVIDTVPLLVLGVGPEIAAVLATVRATIGVVQHANVDLERGRQWLVNAPSYHRTHHDANASEANHNYASTLLVWDRLFGTLHRAPAPDVVGVEPVAYRLPLGYLGQLLYPFCGARLDTTCMFAKQRWLTR